MHFINRFIGDDSGSNALEYGLIVALIAVVIIGAVTAERLDTLREADWIVIDEVVGLRRATPRPRRTTRDSAPTATR